MFSSHIFGALLALTAAIVWGAADFTGGFATRRSNQFKVLALSSLAGMATLAILALIRAEPWPSTASSLWAAAAGIAGAVGIAALYYALSLGNAAVVSPTTAVLGAALPVLFTLSVRGYPSLEKIVGFITAVLGIWLVSKSSAKSSPTSRYNLGLAMLSGFGFGMFFILIAQVQAGAVFTPLLISKSVSFGLALLMIGFRKPAFSSILRSPAALLAGTLDAGGNIFFILAKDFTRLDVASILAGMYAATTVILAKIVLQEIISPRQWAGVVFCTLATALIIA